MLTSKRIVIIAAEESGDMHAAALVRQLNAENNLLEFTGVGGRHLESAGVHLVSDLARYGATGLTEILRHIFVIKKAIKTIKAHLVNTKPDLLILVDSPSLNLRLAKFAKRLGIRILYYISPQIWAWKANRIKIIQANIDRMAVIFPFEKTIYQRAGVPVSFVGHPLISTIPAFEEINTIRQRFNIPINKRVVAMLPGSRRNEIDKHMPVLVSTAELLNKKANDLHFVIPIAGTINPHIIKQYFAQSTLNISFVQGNAPQVIACSDCVVVASGTASLECALLEKPMCIIYKASFLTFIAATQLIKVKYLGLCNLLQNQMIVPELLQYDCNAQELSQTLYNLLNDQEIITGMQKRLNKLRLSLSAEQADCSLAELVKTELNYNQPIPVQA